MLRINRSNKLWSISIQIILTVSCNTKLKVFDLTNCGIEQVEGISFHNIKFTQIFIIYYISIGIEFFLLLVIKFILTYNSQNLYKIYINFHHLFYLYWYWISYYWLLHLSWHIIVFYQDLYTYVTCNFKDFSYLCQKLSIETGSKVNLSE